MSSWLTSPERRTGTNSSPTSSSILNSAWGMNTVDSVLKEKQKKKMRDHVWQEKVWFGGKTLFKWLGYLIPTISWVHNLHCCGVRKLQHCHDWVWQLYLKGLWGLKLLVCKDLHFPGGCGLAGVKLDLFLGFTSEVLILLGCAILCGNT